MMLGAKLQLIFMPKHALAPKKNKEKLVACQGRRPLFFLRSIDVNLK
jgi:hypothetical protein